MFGVLNVRSDQVSQELKLQTIRIHRYVNSLEAIVQAQVRTHGNITGETISLELNYYLREICEEEPTHSSHKYMNIIYVESYWTAL